MLLLCSIQSRQISCMNSVIIKLLFHTALILQAIQVLLVFEIVFSASVISWIESIGGGCVGGGGGGLKHPFELKEQCFAFSV